MVIMTGEAWSCEVGSMTVLGCCKLCCQIVHPGFCCHEPEHLQETNAAHACNQTSVCGGCCDPLLPLCAASGTRPTTSSHSQAITSQVMVHDVTRMATSGSQAVLMMSSMCQDTGESGPPDARLQQPQPSMQRHLQGSHSLEGWSIVLCLIILR